MELNQDYGKIRKPAVAGSFYSSDNNTLHSEIKQVTDNIQHNEHPRLMISPHAGYVFSGSIAAKILGMISPSVSTVFLIGPSHHVWFEGIVVSDMQFYTTPLGDVPVETDIIYNLKKNKLVTVNIQAELPEHCLEVQLPFLQTILRSFSIVPILTGNCAPTDIANLLFPLLTDNTVVIASSDFSHYHSYKQALDIDKRSLQTIISGNYTGFLDACGETAIRCIMLLANKLTLKPKIIDYKNSYDTAPEYCSDRDVVGYAAVGYF